MEAHASLAADDAARARERIVSSRQSALAARRERSAHDADAFGAEGHSPAAYVASLGGDTPQAVSAAVRALEAAAGRSAAELRRAVFRQNADHVLVSEALARFADDVDDVQAWAVRLRAAAKALSDLSLVEPIADAELLDVPDADTATGALSSAQGRNSPAVSSSGSSSIDVPASPGSARTVRSLVGAVDGLARYAAGDAALLREDSRVLLEGPGGARAATLILFSDALAVAQRPAGRPPVAGASPDALGFEARLALVHRWALGDVAASAEGARLLVAVRGGERVWLVTPSPQAASEWAAAVLEAALAAAADAPSKSGTHGVSGRPAAAPGIGAEAAARVEGLVDEAQTAAATAQYDAAVSAVDRARAALAQGTQPGADAAGPARLARVSARLRAETDVLASMLLDEVGCALAGRASTAAAVRRLDLLGRGAEARTRFLSARSAALAARLAAQPADRAAFAVCAGIASAADWHAAAFGDDAGGALVLWTRVELAALARVLSSHLRSACLSDTDTGTGANPSGTIDHDSIASARQQKADSTHSGTVAIDHDSVASARQPDTDMKDGSFSPSRSGVLSAHASAGVFSASQSAADQAGRGGSAVNYDHTDSATSRWTRTMAVLGSALAEARRHVSSLRLVGMDMLAFWDDQMLPCVEAVLSARRAALVADVRAAVDAESWVPVHSAPAGVPAGLSASAAVFVDRLQALLADADALVSSADASSLLVDAVVRSAAVFVEFFCEDAIQAASRGAGARTALSVLAHLTYISGVLLRELSAGLRARFRRGFADLGRLHARVSAAADALLDVYAEDAAAAMLPADLAAVYASVPRLDDRPNISDWLAAATSEYARIVRDAGRRADVATAVLGRMVTALAATEDAGLPPAGAQQRMLDVAFLLLAAAPFVRGVADEAEALRAVCERALPLDAERSVAFFEQRASQLLHSAYPVDFGP